MSRRARALRCGPAIAVALGASLVPFLIETTTPASAAPTASRAGVWTVAVENGNRQCRVQLREDHVGTGLGLAMPPGCRRALPILSTVRTWMPSDTGNVSFDDEAGQAVLLFEEQAPGTLRATGPSGDTIVLSAVKAKAATADQTPAATPAAASAPAAAQLVKSRPITVAEVAGNYAVLRGDRDTGCMVTLDEKGKGPKTSLKARLAPACRDQGIVIFDPVGWQLAAGDLVLTARKGHAVKLDRNDAGVWVKTPEDVKALALKRL